MISFFTYITGDSLPAKLCLALKNYTVSFYIKYKPNLNVLIVYHLDIFQLSKKITVVLCYVK